MVYTEKFWLDTYWIRFGERVWRLFKTSTVLIGMLGTDESARYVELTAILTKYLVEKLSEYVELEEPEASGAVGAALITEYMRSIADFAIGKDPTVTLAWVFKNITFEYARASFDTIAEDPRRFDYLADILGLRVIYEPPELLTGGEIDLSLYHAHGYLDKIKINPGVISLGGSRFKYVLRITDEFKPEEESIGSLIIKLGLLAWEILRRKPGILAIYDTVDARSTYLELATGKIPPRSAEIVESLDLGVLGDGKIYTVKDEHMNDKGEINIVFESDQYTVGVPMPRACRDVVYGFKGPLVYSGDLCLESDILLREYKYEINEPSSKKTSVIEFLRGIQPYVFLGLWDFLLTDKGDIILYTRI